ncbi:MAG: Holliday junction resolvase RuvX [Candidatus Paceibacterota bacterium]
MPQGTVSSNLTASAMRFLGIDYGKKRIGIAISDENGVLGFPKIILDNDEGLGRKISAIMKDENITEIVIGESLDFAGKPNQISAEIDTFTRELEKFNLPVHKQKEFLTSVEARKFHGPKSRADASAAALILQRFLDKRNISREKPSE